MVPLVGQRIDGPTGPNTLRLDTLLGSGAFGLVFAATDLTNNRLVAVKIPQIGMLGGQTELVAFANEVLAAREIQHPNVVKILFVQTSLTDANFPYLVMEYVHGGTLKKRLEQLAQHNLLLPIDKLQTWMGQLLDGIEAINARMLHRDIKPDNILIDNEVLKIADFGLSKIIGAATRTRTFKGGQHVLYMAPEGWKLETNAIQLDMYAMGLVFFEMATLNFPYELPADLRGFDFESFKQMHLFQPPKRIRDLRPDIPNSVDQTVQRMLAKRMQDRFGTWSEIRQALATAWGTSTQHQDPTLSSLTARLLEETSQFYQQKTAEECERERLENILAEEKRTDNWQIDQLMNSIRESIDEFNAQSRLGSIKVVETGSSRAWRTFAFEIPFAGEIILRFVQLYPPVQLKRGTVRVYGYLADEDGAGFNYILVRKNDDDIYGEWEICKVGTSSWGDPQGLPSRLEPFGFESQREFREEMRHSEGGIHIYTYRFEPMSPAQFLDVALTFMKRRREKPKGK